MQISNIKVNAMETKNTIQFNAIPMADGHQSNIAFWAAYWDVTLPELQEIIETLGSASFLRIDAYMKLRKASA